MLYYWVDNILLSVDFRNGERTFKRREGLPALSKYRKSILKSRKIAIYTAVAICIIALNMINLIDVFYFSKEAYTVLQKFTLVSSISISFISLLYCVMQDIIRTSQEAELQFHFEEGDIPFVDREELLMNVLAGILEKMQTGGGSYTKNIYYSPHNGKKSFAKRLCYELQKIKNQNGENSYCFPKKIASKIGNIFLVEYLNNIEQFEESLKTNFTYIKNRKNIVVVVSSSEVPPSQSDSLKDKDIFFVFLNFNTHSDDDALFFADDKIVELLNKLQEVPAYAPLCKGKSKTELKEMAKKLGNLSHNNIGTIVALLSSNDFALLMETDRAFVDFYIALKNGQYADAQEKYLALPQPAPTNQVFRYKLLYERANLSHFLGEYEDAYRSLEEIITMMSMDQMFASGPLGTALYFDTVILQSHIRKHQGKFDEAANLLNLIDENQKSLTWKRAHFSTLIFQLNEIDSNSAQWKTLLKALTRLMADFREERELRNSEFFFYETYYPIAAFYNSGFSRKMIPKLIKIEDKAIHFYEREERRYLTNCYFIKAELLRIAQCWDDAEEYYRRCYDIYCHNGDKDILYLVAIAYKCLQQFEGVTLKTPFDCDAAILECKQQVENYGFHRRLISQMELATVDQEIQKVWLAHYRNTINPIP